MKLSTGYNTYIVALAIILMAAGGFLQGAISLQEAVDQALNGLGLGTLRMGLAAAAVKNLVK